MIGGDQEGSSAGARLAVAGVFLGLLVLQWWLAGPREPAPGGGEEAFHIRSAAKYAGDAAGGRWTGFLHPLDEPGRAPAPPLFHIAAAAGVSAGGRLGLSPEGGALLANLFFLFLLSWGAYLLASDWWGEAAGAAAAFLTSLLPPFLAAARVLSPDAALAAWVLLSYAMWERSRRFTVWTSSLMLGAVLGAGFLTDAAFPFYAAPVAAAVLWELFRPVERGSRIRAAAALAAAVFLAGPWYGINFPGLWTGIFAPSGGGPGGLDAVFYYPGVVKEGIGWIALAAAGAGFVWTALRYARNGWVLASWLVSSWILWTLVPDKDPRRMLPVLPVLSLSAAGLPFRLPLLLAAALAVKACWP